MFPGVPGKFPEGPRGAGKSPKSSRVCSEGSQVWLGKFPEGFNVVPGGLDIFPESPQVGRKVPEGPWKVLGGPG
eukprot:13527370-Alexandrium_andersonii.AAC.1